MAKGLKIYFSSTINQESSTPEVSPTPQVSSTPENQTKPIITLIGEQEIIINVGEPVHEILTVAEKEQAGLIVIGRKKRIEIEDSFIGSYTHRALFILLVLPAKCEVDTADCCAIKINILFTALTLSSLAWSSS